MSAESGTVTLVGGGPGDPDLITVAGLTALREAEVVLYDRLAPLELLDECPPGAELIDAGKVPRDEFTPQETINELLVDRAKAGRRVVRFKGGDSFVFGRGGEEWQACVRAGIPVRVIPGVTSSVAAPALAGIPVTHRGLTQGFTVVSGHVPPDDERSCLDWEVLARTRTTLVILMGVKYLPDITARLIAGGLDPETPAAIIVHATSSEMKVFRATVATIAEESITRQVVPPAITVIGEVTRPGLLD